MLKLCMLLVVLVGHQVAALDDCGCDTCLLIDESGSVDVNYFDHAKDFLSGFVQTLEVGPTAHQIAMMKFGGTGDQTPIFDLLQYTDTSDVVTAIGAVSYGQRPATDIGDAIGKAVLYCFGPNSGNRDYAPDVLVVVTDGGYSNAGAVAAANAARSQGIILLSVGIDVTIASNAAVIKEIAAEDEEYYWINPALASDVLLSEFSMSYQKICERCKFDMCFVIDESGSISNDEYDKIQQFLKDFVDSENFAIGVAHAQFGLVEYWTTGNLIFDLDDYPTGPLLQDQFDNMSKHGGGTQTFKGIATARTDCFGPGTGDRPYAPNIMVVFTDGGDSQHAEAELQAQQATNDGIIMVSIGVGSVNSANVRDLSLNVPSRYFQPNGDFSTILADLVTLTSSICEKGCIVDMCFVVDESGSITQAEWYFMKTFMMGFITQTHVSPWDANFGLVEFYGSAALQFDTHTYLTIGPLLAHIAATPQYLNGTHLATGINTATTRCFTQDRPNAPKVMVIMSDGGDSDTASALTESNSAKADGIHIITISVGNVNAGDATFLENIASNGPGNVYSAPNQFDWVPLIDDFTDLYHNWWCDHTVCCTGVYAGADLWDFEGNALSLPDNKTVLFQFTPNGDNSSPCKVELGWDRNADPYPEKWVTIHLGVHPNNTDKYFRQVDFSRIVSAGDKPTQRGWKCKPTVDVACPGQNPNDPIGTYPYTVKNTQTPADSYAEVLQWPIGDEFSVVQLSDCGALTAKFELFYVFNPDLGQETFQFTIDSDFYYAYKSQLSGFCVP